MNQVVIIGGGIHGTYLSGVLVRTLGWTADQIKVIDPYDSPCGRWKELTARTGMEFLRSPIVHNLGLTAWELRQFKKKNAHLSWAKSFGPKERPSLALFNRHVDSLCRQHGLAGLRVKAEALTVEKNEHGLRVRTTAGHFDTRRVVLATSSNDGLAMPFWSSQIASFAKHIFQPDFTVDALKPGEKIVVVGTGITAAQVALRLSEKLPGNVKLLIRRPFKIAEFDSDACWMGPKCLKLFAAEKSYVKRREMIKSARNKGTVTPEVYTAVRRSERMGKLEVCVAEVDSARLISNEMATLFDAGGNALASGQHVILATGFVPGRPGGSLLDQVVSHFRMPVAEDGFPIVDKLLHWKDGVYVMGALAELEIGPPARNILGARLAGERLRMALHPLADTFVGRIAS